MKPAPRGHDRFALRLGARELELRVNGAPPALVRPPRQLYPALYTARGTCAPGGALVVQKTR